MRWLVAIAIAVFALAVAHKVKADPRWVTPPAKYVHKFRGNVVMHWNLTPIAFGAFVPVYGLSFVVGNTCHIQVWRAAYNASLYRHELAHCNSWPAWHPKS